MASSPACTARRSIAVIRSWARRLAAAREEMSHVGEFDYATMNDDFQTALEDLRAIVRTQRLRRDRQLRRYQNLFNSIKKK